MKYLDFINSYSTCKFFHALIIIFLIFPFF